MMNQDLSGAVSVRWPEIIKLQSGQSIKVTGRQTGPESMDGWTIIERSGQIHQTTPLEELEGQEKFMSPLMGIVLECVPQGNETLISVFPTVIRIFQFSNIASQRFLMAMPEYWSFLEERRAWQEDVIPDAWKVRELNRNRFDPPDVRSVSSAVQRFARLTRIMSINLTPELLGQIVGKLEQLHRLETRSIFANEMWRNLLAASRSEGRTFLLEEACKEGPLVLEQSCVIAFSILDLIGTWISSIFELGIPEFQVGFTSAYGRPPADSETPKGKSLSVDFPNHPLTKLFQDQIASWIGDLRKLRHFVVHSGCLQPVYGGYEHIWVSLTDDPSEMTNSKLVDPEQQVRLWRSKLDEFLSRTFAELERHVNLVCEGLPEPEPPGVKAANINTSAMELAQDTFRLLATTNEQEANRTEYLYSRLESKWKNVWPMGEFAAYVGQLTGVRYDNTSPVTSSFQAGTENAMLYLRAEFSAHPVRLVLHARKVEERPFLILDALTTPQYFER